MVVHTSRVPPSTLTPPAEREAQTVKRGIDLAPKPAEKKRWIVILPKRFGHWSVPSPRKRAFIQSTPFPSKREAHQYCSQVLIEIHFDFPSILCSREAVQLPSHHQAKILQSMLKNAMVSS